MRIGRVLAVLSVFLGTSSSLRAAEWEPVATRLLETEKPGYGGLCGIVVDHATGEVIVNVSDRGLYRSKDLGETWTKLGTEPIKGRTESPGCLVLDPTGKSRTIVSAFVYGAPVAVGTKGGESFRHMHERSAHVDWCAVDWTDPKMRFVLALKHEQGGLLIGSNDGGATFRDVGKGYAAAWVFDGRTAIVAHGGGHYSNAEPTIQRTTDGGRTFEVVGKYAPVGRQSAVALPKWRDGKLYWLVKEGLIVTDDSGRTWKPVGRVDRALYGPIFGKDDEQMFVLTSAGVVETTDGGTTWSDPIPVPKDMKGGLRGLAWLEYDPVNDVLYLMKMTSDLYRLKRG